MTNEYEEFTPDVTCCNPDDLGEQEGPAPEQPKKKGRKPKEEKAPPKPKREPLLDRVGKVVHLPLKGMVIELKVKEARIRCGHDDLLCEPVAGSGEAWVQGDKLILEGG